MAPLTEALLHIVGRVLPWACAVLLLAAILSSCASTPSEPCHSLECIKRDQRETLRRACVRAANREYVEEVAAGLVDPSSILVGCAREARRLVP